MKGFLFIFDKVLLFLFKKKKHPETMIVFFIMLLGFFLIILFVLHKMIVKYAKRMDKNYKIWNIYYWEFIVALSIIITFGTFYILKITNLFPFLVE